MWHEGWDLLSGDEPVARSVVERFSAEMAAISHDALCEPTGQVAYFRQWSRFDRERIVAFGIRVLESYGNGADRSVLRHYASSREHGRRAIAALKAIEERTTKVSGSAA